MIKKFYEETGMYIDWQQLNKLPEINTLIDIGVGSHGTEDLYDRFKNAKLILIDPIDEAKEYAHKLSKKREVNFFQNALGRKDGIEKEMKLQKDKEFSSFLEISEINMKDDYVEKRKLIIKKLDTIIDKKDELGKIGIKIDTEGFELNVIKGASKTLKNVDFVLAEVRHNHKSFKNMYSLSEFVEEMFKNNFILTMIVTAKPFIADLCFQPRSF